ncbi:MAG: hypothetical protein JRI34_14120 [Deltaproteobacteria bacterium]|nr:hypothetical protein [Deltaproteobacteria bacterium]
MEMVSLFGVLLFFTDDHGDIYGQLIPGSNLEVKNQLDFPAAIRNLSATCQKAKGATSQDYALFSSMVPKAGFEPARA